MMKSKKLEIKDIGRNPEQLLKIDAEDLMELPFPDGQAEKDPPVNPLSDTQKETYECSLDGVLAVGLPKPESKEEEDRLVASFLRGLKKLFSKEDNWTFLQPLTLSLEYCAKCLACSEECPVYLASGQQDITAIHLSSGIVLHMFDLPSQMQYIYYPVTIDMHHMS